MSQGTVGRPMEILLVEDNLEDARVTIESLRSENVKCRVTLVCDGEEALNFLQREGIFAQAPRPDLILLDMELPKKDGPQVLTEIRACEALKNIPVVVLTASLVHRAVLEGLHLRVDGYMTKPVDWGQFLAVVKDLRRSWLAEVILPPLILFFLFALGGMAQAAPPVRSDPNSTPPQMRFWRDNTGAHTVRAALLGVEEGKVRLKKPDGSVITLSLDKLSEFD